MRCTLVRAGAVAICLAGIAPQATSARAQDAPDLTAIADPAVAAVTASLTSEVTLLAEALERYRSLARQRPDAQSRLVQLHESLDAEAAKEAEAVPDRLDQLVEIAGQAAADLGARLEVERDALRRIGDHVRRVAALERRLAELEGRSAPEETGALSGTWDLVLMPLDQKGSCVLDQTGAVLNGTYRLQGGYSGSLQGTLVNRKIYLVRIDSRLGKMMELEGFLSADGNVVRGTWLNYELAGAEGSTGHWSATRRAPAR